MSKIQPLSKAEIAAMPKHEFEQKCLEINQAIVVTHALMQAVQVNVEFLRYYQFMITNKPVRTKILKAFNEQDYFVNELTKLFKSKIEMKTHAEEQEEFSYKLLEELAQVATQYTSNELGFSITKIETE